MINVRQSVISLLFIIIIGHVSFSVLAQDNKRVLKIGIVDIEFVTRQSLMAKDIARQIDIKRREFMSEIKEAETSLRGADEELQKKRILLSPEAFNDEARKFRVKTTNLRKKVQDRNKELSQLRSVANRAMEKAIATALSKITKVNGYNLVFRYSPQVILVRPNFLDISKPVLTQLNKDSPVYDVSNIKLKDGK
ncbi:MAG: OmpH family outer membrane protein [Rhodospirillales bacterium]|nr:OmpH family outer membrane protein [Rhodospirillales bacterium]